MFDADTPGEGGGVEGRNPMIAFFCPPCTS